jgi:hypothetical protein
MWCESVSSVEIGKARIDALSAKTPGQHVIISLTTGHRKIFGMSSATGSAEKRKSSESSAA